MTSWKMLTYLATVARDRAQGPEGDQRKEAGATRQGRIFAVSDADFGFFFPVLTLSCSNLESRLAAQGSQSEFRE